ncbi:molybdenum cofactor guanylyltransferase [Pseudoalteromonas sp. OOF1S-7]|uniref:molybdenum cofactor guanylyltransferase n=1 Tax=Pseudoalteromonas sp. OOF1S-7 TaxID=2917757 RepID=UPI001EF6ACB2|nr:molybdenum cofactor guanylyltransferase [Pseudoalteromonas sp. OOF1S-7]MCG7533473.1 molybdenum cofactor guanylyltransferase [Pseudoalteromonas sp. OOF1S-7]
MLLGIILAGGQSHRMGTDKATLCWQGDTLLSHAQQLLLAVGCDQVLISRNGLGYVQDIYTGKGPLAGIHACLEQQVCDEAVVIPIDMPLLSSACLSALINQGRTAQHSCHYADSVLPCYLSDYSLALTQCRSQLSQSRLSVRGFLGAIAASVIEGEQPHSELTLMNTNTPEQWACAQQIMQQETVWAV